MIRKRVACCWAMLAMLMAHGSVIEKWTHGSENAKCTCQPPPSQTKGDWDSAFYRNSLQFTCILSVITDPSDVVVTLDETEIGTTPFEGIKVTPGKHVLSFSGSSSSRGYQFDTTMMLDSGITSIHKILKQRP